MDAAELAYVRERALRTYTPEGVERWMENPNRMLGGATPTELVARGEAQRVLDLLGALESGAVL